MKSLLITLARQLVTQPGRVQVREFVRDGQTVLELGVAEEDRGRVIGRNGRTADALRTVLDAVARRQGISNVMEIER